mgnify:CR=1 FL=1
MLSQIMTIFWQFYGNQTKYVATPDINECATEEQSCSADAVCNNTEGSYDCECKPGFSGDGWTCKGKTCSLLIVEI